jgi:hypothetical protein
VGTARQNISMVGCCRLPFGTASRSVRVLLKVPYLHYFSPLPRPSLDEKTRSITVPVVVPASRSEGALHQGKAHWLDLPLQPLPPCIKRRAAYSVLLTERLYRLPTLLLTGNQLAPVLPSLRHPLLVAHATTMRPSTPCGLVVFIGCLRPFVQNMYTSRSGRIARTRIRRLLMSPNKLLKPRTQESQTATQPAVYVQSRNMSSNGTVLRSPLY